MQRQNDSIYGIWGQKERRKADIEGRMAGRQVGRRDLSRIKWVGV